MKTKNYEIDLNFYVYLNRWILPLGIDVEVSSKDWIDVCVFFLCFNVRFWMMSHKYAEKLDKMFNEAARDLEGDN